MAVEIKDEDFDVIRDALRLATSNYGEDDIADVLIAERKARKIVEAYDAERQ